MNLESGLTGADAAKLRFVSKSAAEFREAGIALTFAVVHCIKEKIS
jgi:hypothetical protein